ncbi:3-methyladenine DNA glycosylase/8-oxoguanine DNA glycosylase [Cenarchaeum symbiosum A]|uniref:3-methyladenine DNA glycosylase/8-oxoguanine DNA glycosylase n=1 Tax=Cenarchaeum symbiosum (strain A) TaxID=414004 RepID=A0RYQ2_CENSY|nr:3-methyladenine DNA glycosylase/8-oxoguanine DNA glycosylase [Cenarchaeum symbiosum A]
MARLIRLVGEYNPRRTRNRHEALVRSIITQQLSGSAASSILARFRALYGGGFPRPADVARTPARKLQQAGISAMKADYIRGLSGMIDRRELKLAGFSRMGDEEVVAELVRVRGVGRWTAEMFLIFALGRQDVLPLGDLGLRKGVMKLCSMDSLPTDAEIVKTAERWRPYRTAATWYLWKGTQGFRNI